MSDYIEFVESLPKVELPTELTNEGIKVIEIPAATFGTRKKFINLKPEHTDFKQGMQVLPAEFVGRPDQGPLYFYKYHPVGSKFYPEGGYQCTGQLGGYRSFYTDALMIHPSEMKTSQRVTIEGMKKRGRKSKGDKVVKDPNAPKGTRGRKPLSPEEKAKREAEKQAKLLANPDRKRGRKPLSEEEKAKRLLNQTPKQPGTGKRGRPPVPEHLRKSKPYVPTGGKRGRPSKK